MPQVVVILAASWVCLPRIQVIEVFSTDTSLWSKYHHSIYRYVLLLECSGRT